MMAMRPEDRRAMDLVRINYFYERFFGAPLDMNNFQNRIRLQKLIYILQSHGVDFENYHFRWYLRGPYSPRLADDGYAFSNNVNGVQTLADRYTIQPQETQILERIERAQELLIDSENAELIASYIYLQQNHGANTLQELHIRKPHFSPDEIRHSMNLWHERTRE